MTPKPFVTTAEAAVELGWYPWQVARLYRESLLDEPPRSGRNRIIPRRDLPKIKAALAKRWPLMAKYPLRTVRRRPAAAVA